MRKSGNTLRITAQLIRASRQLRTCGRQTYDRELTDVFKVQDEIAAAVVAALKVTAAADAIARQTHRAATMPRPMTST